DQFSGQRWLVAENEAEMEMASAELEAAVSAAPVDTAVPHGLEIEFEPGTDFKHKVDRIREYIRAGDVFQVNLSRGWEARGPAPVDPAALYAALAHSNPAPF